MKYTVTMEFVGHHDIEFEAESDDEAKQMVEDDTILHEHSPEFYASDECLAINLYNNTMEMIWQI
tara:strand:- start:48 stop:242 length:195 start_codon:yes stop_codon:yes gene_type:complete